MAFQVLKKILKRKRSLSDSVLVKDVGINCIAFTNSRKVYKYQISGMAHNKEVFVRRKCQFRKEKQEKGMHKKLSRYTLLISLYRKSMM